MIHDTQSDHISQKQDRLNIYVIMKIMCPPCYLQNGFVSSHAFRHIIYGYILLALMNQRVPNKLTRNVIKLVISDPLHTETQTQIVNIKLF